MSTQLSAREVILGRIRAAVPPATQSAEAEHATIERQFQRVGTLSADDRLHLLLDRLTDYNTEIVQVANDTEIAGAIAEVLTHANEQKVVIAPEFPDNWLPSGFDFQRDNSLPIDTLESAQAVLTTCEVAVASTGTIILVHGGMQGRRAATLLPDHHICLVRRDQIVETVPEAFEAVAAKSTSPITTISGPSATSDIEMTRIKGVHGPRRLTVILYGTAQKF